MKPKRLELECIKSKYNYIKMNFFYHIIEIKFYNYYTNIDIIGGSDFITFIAILHILCKEV